MKKKNDNVCTIGGLIPNTMVAVLLISIGSLSGGEDMYHSIDSPPDLIKT